MILAGKDFRAPHPALGAATLIAIALAAPLAGCKNNTSSAATPERRVGKPPVVIAQYAPEDPRAADPLTSPVWQNAAWWTLSAPANTTHTTTPGKAALLFDDAALYVAVICDLPASADPDGPADPDGRDGISLFLDPKGQGRELLQVSADSTGTTHCAWIRTSAAIEPLEDGSPNLGFPLDVRPDCQFPGLDAQVRRGILNGRPVWTLQLAVPVAGMPALMQALPAPDAPWKFNILRTCLTGTGGQREILQSNLSPVHVNAQSVSPYRMAELDFAR